MCRLMNETEQDRTPGKTRAHSAATAGDCPPCTPREGTRGAPVYPEVFAHHEVKYGHCCVTFSETRRWACQEMGHARDTYELP